MRTLSISISIIFVLISLLIAAAISKVEVSNQDVGIEQAFFVECQGRFNNVDLTGIELQKVIHDHKTWLNQVEQKGFVFDVGTKTPYAQVTASQSSGSFAPAGFASGMPSSTNGNKIQVSDEGRADLCGARISGLSFQGADLRYARLMGARIVNTDFSNSNFRWAYLDGAGFLNSRANPDVGGADFSGATLNNSLFSRSDFSGSDFWSASFVFANISESSFKGTNFWSSDFRNAELRDVDFSEAYVSRARFDNALLNFKAGKIPDPESFRDAKGLTSLFAYGGAEASLKEIRDQLNSKKLLLPASEINFALNSEQSIKDNKDRYFPLYYEVNWLMNGLTYAYGLKPERLIYSAALIAAFFSYIYYVAISYPINSRRDGIWITFPTAPNASSSRQPKTFRLSKANCNPIRAAIWFSVLSAFRIGWGNLSVGDWISRVQPHSFTYQATGWPRAIAGIQSLITVYFLILLVSKYVF